MGVTGSLISALIATYAVSRLLWRALASLPRPTRLVSAHLLSLVSLMAFVAWVKSYFVSFPFEQTLVLIAPQLFWLGVDWLRGRVSVRA